MYVDAAWIQNTFLELVQIDSHSLSEGRMAKRCKDELINLGFSVIEDEAGRLLGGETGNLIATLIGDKDRPPVLLAAHMDTVKPGQHVQPFVDEQGIVWSDGTTVLGADDKAGVTAILGALRAIREHNIPHGTIQVVLTIAEEIGLQGARHVDGGKLCASYGLSLDSSGSLGTYAVAGPAQVKWSAHIQGKAAHAGVAPEEGISAIKVAAQAVAAMPHGRIDDETTVNIGRFIGEAPTNIVADSVTLLGEARSRNPIRLQETLDAISLALHQAAEKAGAVATFTAEQMYDGFRFGERDGIRKRVVQALQEAGYTPHPVEVGGGSDANILQTHVPMMNIGIGYQDIHSTREHIAVSDIVGAATVALAFCTIAEDGS